PAAADLPGELRARLSAPQDEIWLGPIASDDREVLDTFYTGRRDAAVWFDPQGITEKARQLSQVLLSAGEHGLEPDYYHAGRIAELIENPGEESRAELELRLSLSLIRFASDLDSGRLDPRLVDPEHYSYPQNVDRAAVLPDSLAASDIWVYLRAFQPQQNEYVRLKGALSHYRSLAEGGGWAPIPEGETLKPGMTDPRVAALRGRLLLLGDLDEAAAQSVVEAGSGAIAAPAEGEAAAAAAPGESYEGVLVAALKRFQHRHGLTEDGAVGPKTLAALNVSAEQRVEQIQLNMERRRWMADDRGGRYIFVNLANFDAKIVDGLDTVFHTKVVVGDPYHRTPVFSDTMTYLEINPTWNVPESIARKELLPKIRENPGYLAERNYTLLASWDQNAPTVDPHYIDWSQISASSFPFRIRQEAGAGNALGRIKFMFPNEFNIYLHDTPSQSHFARSERAFSHGCIRVAKPLELAEALLKGQEGWDLERVRQQIESGETRTVSLDEPIQVHISYITAWVNKDGAVHFRNDVYGRDELLASALLGDRS
ncbi:MAG: L,D-transpeptidase family protein, partial [Rhodovibrionaceae bacterium]